MRRTVLFALIFVGGGARAQDVSDLQPPPPAPPSGAGGYGNYTPGMPVPQPQAPGAPPAANGARRGGDYIINDDEGPADGDEEPAISGGERAPTTHVVKKGDTLWNLSASYFKNPWLWPKLWALNPSITNPHWIYPGDVVRLAPDAPQPVAVAPERPRAAAPVKAGPALGLFLRQTGFVEPGELERAGKVIGSKEEKEMLSTLDEAYVSFDAKNPLVPGQRYSVYKVISNVKHPLTGKLLGHMVQIFGEVEVRSVTEGHMARAMVTDSTEPVERGWYVGPLRRQFKMVEPRADERALSGVVVTTLQPRDMVADNMLVFVDRGQKDGIEVGNRFFVVRRGDGYVPLLSTGPIDDKRFPRETIAEILVIDVRDQLATGLVTKMSKEALVGDRVETRVGY